MMGNNDSELSAWLMIGAVAVLTIAAFLGFAVLITSLP